MGKRSAIKLPGAVEKCKLAEICVYDSADVLDQRYAEWVKGWETRYKRVRTELPIKDITFNNSLSAYSSDGFFCEPYTRAALLIDLDVTGTPTDIVILVQVSDDGVKWYQLMDGPLGDLRYEDSAGDKRESINFLLNTSYVRLRAVATGTTAVNTFKLSAKISMVS